MTKGTLVTILKGLAEKVNGPLDVVCALHNVIGELGAKIGEDAGTEMGMAFDINVTLAELKDCQQMLKDEEADHRMTADELNVVAESLDAELKRNKELEEKL